jgi:hypothetical protein
MTSPVLGIDPGASDGASALVDVQTRRVLSWWVWTWMPRSTGPGVRHRPGMALHGVYRLRSDGFDRRPVQLELLNLGQVAHTIRVDVPATTPLVLEMPFGGRKHKGRATDPHDAIVLSEASGILLGILGHDAATVHRPLASEWRAPHGWAALSADDAEARAVEWARRSLMWPDAGRLRSLPHNELGALAEAAAIACDPLERAAHERRTA